MAVSAVTKAAARGTNIGAAGLSFVGRAATGIVPIDWVIVWKTGEKNIGAAELSSCG